MINTKKVSFIQSLSTMRDSYIPRKVYEIPTQLDQATAESAIKAGIAHFIIEPDPVAVPEPVKPEPKKAEPKKEDKAETKAEDAKK